MTTVKDVQRAQVLIERCMLEYMPFEEVQTKLNHESDVEPALTQVVWRKLQVGSGAAAAPAPAPHGPTPRAAPARARRPIHASSSNICSGCGSRSRCRRSRRSWRLATATRSRPPARATRRRDHHGDEARPRSGPVVQTAARAELRDERGSTALGDRVAAGVLLTAGTDGCGQWQMSRRESCC